MSKYLIHTPQPIPIAGGGSHPVKKGVDRLTPSTEEEKRAARERVQWSAKGHGRGAYIEMFCLVCSQQTTIENVTLNAGVFHCGRRERVPERTYEAYCVLKDNDGRARVPVRPERPYKVRYF